MVSNIQGSTSSFTPPEVLANSTSTSSRASFESNESLPTTAAATSSNPAAAGGMREGAKSPLPMGLGLPMGNARLIKA